ncbi:MAG: right-handed parallel beta-helix repeat-containing protein [Planctomycetes bacterium]|nr:right-handed parallel beta-helix repeat-containing protein [Planctomycetota bacterium]
MFLPVRPTILLPNENNMIRRLIAFAILSGLGLLAFLAFRPSTGTSDDNKEKPTLPYGLIGDGRADDTAALQKAIDAGNGSIHLPKGTYRITQSIVVNLDKTGFTAFSGDGTAQIVMAGPGPAIKFMGTHGGTAEPRTFKADVWERQRTPMVDGIEIVGAHDEADGIEAEGTMQLTVTRTVIRQCRHGIHLVKRNRNVLISACHIYQNRGIGVFYDNVSLHQSNIDGCHISYCEGGGIVSRGGDVRNLHIGTCDIESNMSAAGPPTANVLLDSTGGSIAEVAITGCTIQHNDKGKDSANIRILGRGDGLKKKDGVQWGHVTITGNVLSDVQHNIDIDNARGVTITGNTFWMAYQYNLRVKNSEQIVVGTNVFERNPGYSYGTSLQCKNALLFENCRDCTLNALHIHNVYGVDAAMTMTKCRRFNMTGLAILDCNCIGLLLNDVSDSRLSDCLIRNDTEKGKEWLSLKVIGGKGNLFADNMTGHGAEVPKDSVIVPRK